MQCKHNFLHMNFLHVQNRPRDLQVLTLVLEKLHTTITNCYEKGNVLYIIACNLSKGGGQETNGNFKINLKNENRGGKKPTKPSETFFRIKLETSRAKAPSQVRNTTNDSSFRTVQTCKLAVLLRTKNP